MLVVSAAGLVVAIGMGNGWNVALFAFLMASTSALLVLRMRADR